MLVLAQQAEKGSPFAELIGELAPRLYSWSPRWKIGGLDMSVTNAVVNMWLAAAICVGIIWIGARKRRLVPSGLQNAIEVAVDFVKVNIVYSVMSPKDARRWFPFVGTVFFFIFLMNAMGLVPYIGYSPTVNIWVTGALAVNIYLMAVAIGMAKHGVFKFWKKTLVPPDVPTWLLPLMIPIEMISQLARPLSLAVRLFANMLADHLILLVFLGFIFLAGSTFVLGHVFIIPVAMSLDIVFTAFAIFVAFIQAVIFAFLTTIYINDALHPGH